MQRFLHRSHIWLGWLVGIQLFLWTLSGLVMTAMPIGDVRGEHLKAPHRPIPLHGMAGLLPPESILSRAGPDADGLLLRTLDGRPVYELREGAAVVALLDARTGAPIRLDAAAIERLAVARHAGGAAVRDVKRVPAGQPPLEFRRDDPAWAVRFADPEGSVFYLHAITGDLLAVRTDRWRLFDLMWGLHIMDWREREDINHPLLVAAAALGTAAVGGGLGLLALRWRRRRRGTRLGAGQS